MAEKNKFGENKDGEKGDWARISFYGLSKEQMEHLKKAESELLRAGVSFDTGHDLEENQRDWEFDWSLKGARVQVKEQKVKGNIVYACGECSMNTSRVYGLYAHTKKRGCRKAQKNGLRN